MYTAVYTAVVPNRGLVDAWVSTKFSTAVDARILVYTAVRDARAFHDHVSMRSFFIRSRRYYTVTLKIFANKNSFMLSTVYEPCNSAGTLGTTGKPEKGTWSSVTQKNTNQALSTGIVMGLVRKQPWILPMQRTKGAKRRAFRTLCDFKFSLWIINARISRKK